MNYGYFLFYVGNDLRLYFYLTWLQNITTATDMSSLRKSSVFRLHFIVTADNIYQDTHRHLHALQAYKHKLSVQKNVM